MGQSYFVMFVDGGVLDESIDVYTKSESMPHLQGRLQPYPADEQRGESSPHEVAQLNFFALLQRCQRTSLCFLRRPSSVPCVQHIVWANRMLNTVVRVKQKEYLEQDTRMLKVV